MGDDEVEAGVLGAEPILEMGGENAVDFCSQFPSATTVRCGTGDGVEGGFTIEVIFTFYN